MPQQHNWRGIMGATQQSGSAHALAEIPALPFITGGSKPRCVDYADVFEDAALERRAHSRADRISAIDADTHAKNVCATCPLVRGCREYALTTRQKWGVWGGMNFPERVDWLIRYEHLLAYMEAGRMSDSEREAALDDVTQIELFSVEAIEAATSGIDKPKRRKSLKILGYGNCPNCSSRRTPIIACGAHNVWREHFYRTWDGATRVCASSYIAVCTLPEDEGAEFNGRVLRCACGAQPRKRTIRSAARAAVENTGDDAA